VVRSLPFGSIRTPFFFPRGPSPLNQKPLKKSRFFSFPPFLSIRDRFLASFTQKWVTLPLHLYLSPFDPLPYTTGIPSGLPFLSLPPNPLKNALDFPRRLVVFISSNQNGPPTSMQEVTQSFPPPSFTNDPVAYLVCPPPPNGSLVRGHPTARQTGHSFDDYKFYLYV